MPGKNCYRKPRAIFKKFRTETGTATIEGVVLNNVPYNDYKRLADQLDQLFLVVFASIQSPVLITLAAKC
ncbi:MAG: hypothetical protein ACO2PM_20100 [Pyrobaculum sp.]